ncbi:hypothetical protein [Photobacterium leiognathi]|uniref:hypothetical protein n=1 Tax=Photobacterium leiognathi TaxID=553611 RepID=UPI002981A720|nr:hypothetical protein [Photobacterium leiognathi]
MLENRVLKFLFSLMLFVSTVLIVIPSFLILSLEVSWPWLFGVFMLTGHIITLPLYAYRVKLSKSNVSYISYSALTSIVIVSIVSISYVFIFNEFRSGLQETPNLLPFAIIPFYILMCFKYRSLNTINRRVATWCVIGVGAAISAMLALFVIAGEVAAESEDENKSSVDSDGEYSFKGTAKYADLGPDED